MRRVTANGSEVRLTPKEFDLLRYLSPSLTRRSAIRKLCRRFGDKQTRDQVEYLARVHQSPAEKDRAGPFNIHAILLTEPWVGIVSF